MEEEISINGNSRLQSTHFFTYNGKKYPFNMKLFKCFSQYFQTNKSRFYNITDINIFDDSDEKFDLSENAIKNFINFCQSKNITLNKENAIGLYKLAKKYNVPLLIDSTNEFIQMHQKEVVVDLLILNLKDEYIGQFDLSRSKNNALNRLLFEYSEKFDFHFINSQLLKTVCELESELIEKTEKFREEQNAHLKEIQDLIQTQEEKNKEKDDQIQQKKNEIDDLIHRQEERNKENDTKVQSLIKQQEERNKENDKKVQSLIKQQEEKVWQIQYDFKSQLDALNDTVRRLTAKLKEQADAIDQLKQKEIKRPNPSFSCSFTSESNPKGIISYLGDSVTLSCTVNNDPFDHPLINITKFDDSRFINYRYGSGKSESDTYITFDFGTSRKIDLYSYFIRSVGFHPKTWRIDGSNDQSNWTLIDRRVNNPNLKNGDRHHFECNEAKHGDANCRYRFIRYAQESSYNGSYLVYLDFFELYGDVFNI